MRVSLVCFAARASRLRRLDGALVERIYADLTGGDGIDLTTAAVLPENRGVAFMGDTKGGAFDVPGELARHGWRCRATRTAGRTPTCCVHGRTAWTSRGDRPTPGSSISAGR